MALDENLNAEEQAQFDAMRSAPEPEASPVEEAATPEPAQPAEGATPEAPAQAEAGEKKRMVEIGALHEERERRRDTEKQLQEERRRFNLAWEKLNAPAQPQQPATAEIPDFAADPAGHILGTMKQTGMSVEQLAQAVQQQQAALAQRAEVERLISTGNLAEQQVRAEIPDYDAAVGFLAQKRMEEAKIMGVPNPAAWFNQLKLEWVKMHGEEAPRKAYELAKAIGYAAPAPVAADPAPAPNADATEKIARVEAGQQQARSLGAARGSSPSGIPPAERISKMTPAEFDAFMTKAEKDGTLKEFMGA